MCYFYRPYKIQLQKLEKNYPKTSCLEQLRYKGDIKEKLSELLFAHPTAKQLHTTGTKECFQWCFVRQQISPVMPTAVKCHPVPSFTAQQRLSSSLELLRKFSCLHGMVSTKKCNLLWPPATCIIVTVQREWQRGEQGTMVLALGPKSNSWACVRNAKPEAQSEFVLLEPLHTSTICYTVFQTVWSSSAK